MKSKESKNNIWDVVVIGGGPAGLMAASTAGKYGAKTLLIEKNQSMGKKLLLTGGGRCNLTNANPDERGFVSKFGKNGSFLFTPLSEFGVDDSIRFFEKNGLKTKTEEYYRVFPESDKASDVLNVLVKIAQNNGVIFRTDSEVSHIRKEKNKIVSIILKNSEEIKAKEFIIATGGKSHPETGSTGDGFVWLKEIGHNIIESNPSLVPVQVKDEWISDMAGISFENIGISVWSLDTNKNSYDWKKEFNKKGKVLITHTGLSGPAILNMSKDIGKLLDKKYEVKIALDFFPGVGLDILNKKVLKVFEENPRKKIKNLSFPEIPEKVYLKMLDIIGMDGEWFANEVKRAERIVLLEMFKKFEFKIDSLLGYDKAISSSGGVDLKEIDFKEMKSKLYDNLFLIGDILDFDKISGGYSLQLCWTTGYVAGKFAAKKV